MRIEYLSDHTNIVPTLAGWSHAHWSYLHPERTFSDVEQSILQGCNKKHIPISLVAMDRAKVVGMIALKISDLKTRPDLSPWLAGLYVDEPHRKKGVGSKLVHEIEKLAARLGANKLFLVTDEAEKFYSRLSWNVKERIARQGLSLTVMEKDITHLR